MPVGQDHERAFACPHDGCGKRFTRRSNLNQHVSAVHDRKQTFECPHDGCGKRFARKGTLAQHVSAVHELVRPFKCPHDGCGKCFSQKGHLDQHVTVVHARKQPFKCPHDGCGKRFSQKENLDRHVSVVHLRIKPFTCDATACDYKAANRTDLVNHVRAVHSAEGHRRQKVSENALAKALDHAGLDFTREHHVDFRCADAVADDKFFRVDYVLAPHNGKIALVECDERQHDWVDTSCDVKRMAEIMETLALGGNTMDVVFIRFNPHAYRRSGRLQKTSQEARHGALVRILQDKAHGLWSDPRPLVVMHMFYDTKSGEDGVEEPVVLSEYGLLRDCVYPCIASV